ncbi:MAG TPA: SHOCT domain-containing protein, partial [Chloroflexia bacterium]|nr:SHOCT domain-containing protein [Chloroflexia bacterium]
GMNGQSRNSLGIVVLVVLGVVVLLPVLAMPFMGMMGFGMMGGLGTGANGWWGWLVMLLFWVLLIGGIVLVAVWLFRQGYFGGGSTGGTVGPGRDLESPESGSGRQSALDILNQRYARGEVDREQYEQIKRDILSD